MFACLQEEPGLGFVTAVPLMVASILGGYLYTLNAAYPWFFVAGVVLRTSRRGDSA